MPPPHIVVDHKPLAMEIAMLCIRLCIATLYLNRRSPITRQPLRSDLKVREADLRISLQGQSNPLKVAVLPMHLPLLKHPSLGSLNAPPDVILEHQSPNRITMPPVHHFMTKIQLIFPQDILIHWNIHSPAPLLYPAMVSISPQVLLENESNQKTLLQAHQVPVPNDSVNPHRCPPVHPASQLQHNWPVKDKENNESCPTVSQSDRHSMTISTTSMLILQLVELKFGGNPCLISGHLTLDLRMKPITHTIPGLVPQLQADGLAKEF